MTTKWQKKIVSLAFIAVLSIVLLTNAFVTLWIMTAIGFNTDGLPSLKIGSQHLHAKGDIFAMKSLFGSSIRTKNGLIVKAFKNLSMVANSDRKHSSAFYISEYLLPLVVSTYFHCNNYFDKTSSWRPQGAETL